MAAVAANPAVAPYDRPPLWARCHATPPALCCPTLLSYGTPAKRYKHSFQYCSIQHKLKAKDTIQGKNLLVQWFKRQIEGFSKRSVLYVKYYRIILNYSTEKFTFRIKYVIQVTNSITSNMSSNHEAPCQYEKLPLPYQCKTVTLPCLGNLILSFIQIGYYGNVFFFIRIKPFSF